MGAGHEAVRARQQAEQFREIGNLAAAQPEEVRQRRTAAEQTYSNVLSRLGAAGTYDLPSTTGGTSTSGGATPGILTTSTPSSGESIFTEKEYGSQLGGPFYGEEGKTKSGGGDIVKKKYKTLALDPTKATSQVENSAQFRIASRLTAEAEQLVARQGPLYDEMLNNLQLPILEGSAAVARQNTEELRRAMQRGGSARRSAFEAIQKIRAQERVNSTKIQQLTQVRGALDSWSRQNAQDVLKFGQDWASNLGGIRESYQSAMDGAASLMTNSAIPQVFNAENNAAAAEQKAFQIRNQMHAENRAKVGQWVSGILGVGTMLLGGGLLAGVTSFGLGAITSGLGGAENAAKAGQQLLGGGYAQLGSAIGLNTQGIFGGGSQENR